MNSLHATIEEFAADGYTHVVLIRIFRFWAGGA
jgi:hypothetical protein